MDIQTRHVCRDCHGSGKNRMTREEALEHLKNQPKGGVIPPGRITPPSDDERIQQMQQCGHCEGTGFIYEWVPVERLKAMLENV